MMERPSRRDFLKTSVVAAGGSLAAPYLGFGGVEVAEPMTRVLGRTGIEVTTLGLGGQASLQWTPEGVDPVAIILKALEKGVRNFDTSNVYGPSQQNLGKAFLESNLVPGLPRYDESRRRSICLASKTMVRYARAADPKVRGWSQGPAGSMAIDDLRRSLSQIFGDGKGAYPAGAYLDLFQIHNLNTPAEIEAIYEGYLDPAPGADRIGALAALVDYRDGTNETGLNPKEERLIRHIGITGHISSPVLMECIQRDERDVIDTMLVAINANDRRQLNHQYNAIPVAKAKNLGIIAMKVFADGAMYTKQATWSRKPQDVVRLVGTEDLPSRPLIEYSISTPGIATAIIGIGQIDSDGARCQLEQNLSAAQIQAGSLSATDRREIEALGLKAKEGQTNWFQLPKEPLGAPRDLNAVVEKRDGGTVVQITWQTAYAGDDPITSYEILRDGQLAGKVPHRPQTSRTPFTFEQPVDRESRHTYHVVTVDEMNRRTSSEPVEVLVSARNGP